MDIDTSRLFNIKSGAENTETVRESASPQLQRTADENKRDNDRAAEVYAIYQKNIQQCGTIRSELIRDIISGEDHTTLLLKAVKAIALMTDDSTFYSRVEQALIAVCGVGLGEQTPLNIKIETTRKRLETLKKSQENAYEPAEKQLISRAIDAHEQKIKELINQQLKGETTA